jgi:hypothetical protein
VDAVALQTLPDTIPAMIEKLEFYHGAAIVRIVEDSRCRSIQKHEGGYVINGNRLLVLKYTTKAHSPWRFTVSLEDQTHIAQSARDFELCVLGLVCGGDGVCAIRWDQLNILLGDVAGWLATKRVFNGCYTVSGSRGTLDNKVALNQWPGILFQEAGVDVR